LNNIYTTISCYASVHGGPVTNMQLLFFSVILLTGRQDVTMLPKKELFDGGKLGCVTLGSKSM